MLSLGLALVASACDLTDEAEAAAASIELREATVLLPGLEEPTTVLYEVKDGLAIYDGDIILGEVDEHGELLPRFRSLVHEAARGGWPRGLVPYRVSAGVNEAEVLAAVALWEDRSDLQFVDYVEGQHPHFVDFIVGTDPNACYSAFGMTGGRQTVRTTPGGSCGLGTMVHEIGHALGLHHEQNRADRDQFVTIDWDAILGGRQGQFCRRAGAALAGDEADYCPAPSHDALDIGPYDYASIMHYGAFDFGRTVNGARQQTIIPVDPAAVLRGSSSPSDGDMAAIRGLYSLSFSKWGDFCTQDSELCATGDFDGDGRRDLVTFHRGSYGGSDEVWVARSTGAGAFVDVGRWTEGLCARSQEQCMTGGFDGDDRDDVIAFHHGAYGGSSQVFVYRSDGTSFEYTGAPWANGLCAQGKEVCKTGDFDGDGRDDALAFHHGAYGGSSQVWVYRSNGTSFTPVGQPWHASFCHEGMTCEVGDVDGDGRDDIMGFVQGTYGGAAQDDVWVSLSTGSGFGPAFTWHEQLCREGERCLVGDGKDDVVAVRHTAEAPSYSGFGQVTVARSTGGGFGTVEAAGKSYCFYDQYECMLGDADGDQREDLVVFTQSSYAYPDGEVWVGLSGLRHPTAP